MLKCPVKHLYKLIFGKDFVFSFHLYQLTKFSKNLIRCIKYLRLIYVTIKYEGVLNDVDQFILYVAYNYMCSLSAPSQDNILNQISLRKN